MVNLDSELSNDECLRLGEEAGQCKDYMSEFRYYYILAHRRVLEGMCKFGWLLMKCPETTEQAKGWLTQAKASSEAQRYLGDIYEKEKDYEQAIKHYQQASKTGDYEAFFSLARIYKKKLRNIEKEQYRLARERGYEKADDRMAKVHQILDDNLDALHLLRAAERCRAAGIELAKKQGSPKAYKCLGDVFTKERNEAEARIELSKKEDSPKAYKCCGDMFTIERNEAKVEAGAYYQLVEDSDNYHALFRLAEMYGKRRLFAEAAYWNSLGIEVARRKDLSSGAYRYLGEKFKIENNDEEAMNFFGLAAEKGDEFSIQWLALDKTTPEAQRCLGDMFKDYDDKRAMEHWLRAAGQGNIEAMFTIAKTYKLLGSCDKADRWNLIGMEAAAKEGLDLGARPQYVEDAISVYNEIKMNKRLANWLKLGAEHGYAGVVLRETGPWTMNQLMELFYFLYYSVYDNKTKSFRSAPFSVAKEYRTRCNFDKAKLSWDIYPPGISYLFDSSYPQALTSDLIKKTLAIICQLSIEDSIEFMPKDSLDRCIGLIRGLALCCSSPESSCRLEMIVQRLRGEYIKRNKLTILFSDPYGKLLQEFFSLHVDKVDATSRSKGGFRQIN